jgi:hypothetical protein
MVASLTFLSPWAALVAVAAVLPLTSFALGRRRLASVRRALRLGAPRGGGDLLVAFCLAAVCGLLGLAAAQPALERSTSRRVRSDAQAYVVIDTSRSMLAAAGPNGRTRLRRAKAEAVALRAALSDVSTGVGTLTDRVLPNLLPSADEAAFDRTVARAIDIQQPPPIQDEIRATTLGALAGVARNGTFAPSARKRVLVVVTDGESRPYDIAELSQALARRPGTALVVIHVWGRGEAIFRPSGAREGGYRPDPASRAQLEALARATGGAVFSEGSTAAAAAHVRSVLGAGPTEPAGRTTRVQTLAPYIALLALLPLGIVLWRRLRR